MNPLFALGMPGLPELFLIGVIALIFFGPKRLPEFARGLGQSLREFHKAKDEFTQELQRSGEAPAKPVAPVETTASVLPPAATLPPDVPKAS